MCNIKNTFKPALLSVLLLSLAACGGSGKTLVTVDDSADYESATSLPPLKKPSATTVASSERKPQTAPTASEASSTANEADTTAVASAPPEVKPEQTKPEQAKPQQVEPQQVEPESTARVEPSTAPVIETAPAQSVSSRVVAGDANNARLQIDAGFDSAWSYLTSNLKRSDVTVFSRNKAAGRFSIGCGNMESVEVIKKGGWSIFNRSKQKRAEYCALSVVERRGKSLVFVLNRDGTEVSSEYSNPLFARILNN